MVKMPPGFQRNELTAQLAPLVLTPPEIQQLPPSAQGALHLQTETAFEVGFPLRVERIRRPLDFCTPTNFGIAGFPQRPRLLPAFRVRGSGNKHPVSSPDCPKVFLFGPTGALIRVPAFCPLPRFLPKPSIDFGESLRRIDLPMIIRPAPDDGIELEDQRFLRRGLLRRKDRFDLGQDGLDVL